MTRQGEAEQDMTRQGETEQDMTRRGEANYSTTRQGGADVTRVRRCDHYEQHDHYTVQLHNPRIDNPYYQLHHRPRGRGKERRGGEDAMMPSRVRRRKYF